MKDLLFIIFFLILLYFTLKKPFLGIGLCLWCALFFPNAWLYGFGNSIRYSLIIMVFTTFSFIRHGFNKQINLGFLGYLVIIFFSWTILSTIFNNSNDLVVYEIANRFFKVILVSLILIYAIYNTKHIELILMLTLLSIGFYGVVEGLKYIASGGGHGISGHAGHSLQDRNELAVAFAMTLPLVLYFLKRPLTRFKLERMVYMLMAFFLVASIIGTDSRGGFISLSFILLYIFIHSKNKITYLIAIVSIISVVYQYIPDDWFSRMNTIENADDDQSFMGRVVAWKLSFILALDHPFLGGGFKAIEYYPNWFYYSTLFDEHSYFYTGDHLPDPIGSHAAHSIYFQVLGDHGFVGFGIFILIFYRALISLNSLSKTNSTSSIDEIKISDIATTIKISLVAYLLGGAALSFAYFDLVWAFLGLTISLTNIKFKTVKIQ